MKQILFALFLVVTFSFSTFAIAEVVIKTNPQEYRFADVKHHYKFMFKGFEEQEDGTFKIYYVAEWRIIAAENKTVDLRFALPEDVQFYKEGKYLYINWNGYNCKVAKKSWGYPYWFTKKNLDAEIDILHRMEFFLNTKHTLILGANLILKDSCISE